MEDIRAIYRIFNNLKYEMENNGWVYQWHLGDEPIKVTHKFNPPVTPEEFQLFEKYFPNMKLPASYKAFLSCSNGMELFCGEEGSSLVSCTIYSLKRALKEKESWNSTPILSDPEFTYHLPVLCLSIAIAAMTRPGSAATPAVCISKKLKAPHVSAEIACMA